MVASTETVSAVSSAAAGIPSTAVAGVVFAGGVAELSAVGDGPSVVLRLMSLSEGYTNTRQVSRDGARQYRDFQRPSIVCQRFTRATVELHPPEC
jgi:hypothetical protein